MFEWMAFGAMWDLLSECGIIEDIMDQVDWPAMQPLPAYGVAADKEFEKNLVKKHKYSTQCKLKLYYCFFPNPVVRQILMNT